MITNLLKLHGCYCTMCVFTQKECHSLDIIRQGFYITRSVEAITDLALALTDDVTGEIPKKKGDYSVRQGIVGVPITKADLCKNIPVCHSKINSFSWVIDLMVRENTCRKWSSSFVQVAYTSEEKNDMKLEDFQFKEFAN